MSAVSNSVIPTSSALWMTLREASSSIRWPKLLQPRPTTLTFRSDFPSVRVSIEVTPSSRAKRSSLRRLDCFVALLLAMTAEGLGDLARRPGQQAGALEHAVEPLRELRGRRHHRQPVLLVRQDAEPLHHVLDGNRIGVEEHRLVELEQVVVEG